MRLFNRASAFQLTGLAATSDGLYDGTFIAACSRWWNHTVESERGVRAAGYRELSTDDVRRLAAVPQPESRALFEAVAGMFSMAGRQSSAVLALAYAFAVVLEAGAVQDENEIADVAFERARALTADDFGELHNHYSQEGWAKEIDQWTPYWQHARRLLNERVSDRLVRSLQATFDDQVDRWSRAEGFDLRRSIGGPDFSLISADENAGFPNFVQLLFEWGGRLRLGERLILSSGDLSEFRFSYDEFNPIDHFYDEAMERYYEVAAQPNPVSKDVESAARRVLDVFEDDLADGEHNAFLTTVIRAYIWRTVSTRSHRFMQPDLDESIEQALAPGGGHYPGEPSEMTLLRAALQWRQDGETQVRLGSLGGLLQGPRSYEKAFWDTTADFAELGFVLDEKLRREAFMFGVCIADVERAMREREQAPASTLGS